MRCGIESKTESIMIYMSKETSNLTGRFYTAVIAVFAFTQFVYLFLINNIISIREVSDLDSLRYIELAQIPIVLILVTGIIVLGVFVIKKFSDKDIPERAEKVLTYLIFFSCLIWVIGSSSIPPLYDRVQVQQAVYGINWGEFEKFSEGGYFWVFPNNGSITLFYYLASLIAGSKNYLLLMLLNAVMMAGIYSDLAGISGMLGAGKKTRVLILASGILFVPSLALATYIYGTVPGLFCSVKALKLAMKCRNKGGIRDGILAGLLAALAVFLKFNYVIFLVAISIYLVFTFIKDRNRKLLISLAAGITAAVILTLCQPLMVKALTGHKLNDGAPSISWVAMGMQDPYGMYNGYNSVTYEELGYDGDAETVLAKEYISERTQEFLEDPAYAVSFYTKKTAATWTDPTFDYILSISERLYSSDTVPSYFWLITRPGAVSFMSQITKVFVILIFLGCASFASTFRKKDTSYESGLILMTFIGGFIFHLIWEGGSSYALPYFITVIPLGIMGLKDLLTRLSKLDVKSLSKLNVDPKGFIWYFTGACLMFLLAALGIGTLKGQIAYDMEQTRGYYSSGINRAQMSGLEGERTISCSSKTIDVTITRYCGRYRLKLLSGDVDVYLTMGDLGAMADYFSYGQSQTYNIFENQDGSCLILTDRTHAMAFDEAEGKLKLVEIPDAYENFYSDVLAEFVTKNPAVCWKIQ